MEYVLSQKKVYSAQIKLRSKTSHRQKDPKICPQKSLNLEHLADHLLLGADEEAHDVIAQRVPVLVEEALHAVPHLTRVVLHTKLQRVHARPEWKKVHWKIREHSLEYIGVHWST